MTDSPAAVRGQPNRPRLNVWWVRLPLLGVLGVTLSTIALLVLVTAYHLNSVGRVAAGVYAVGHGLAGLTLDEAEARLMETFSYDDVVFTFRAGDQFWQRTAGELGVTLDSRASAQAAFAVGHTRRPIPDLLEQARAWVNGVDVPLVIRYDESVAASQLAQIAAELERPASAASLTLDGTTVRTAAAQSGRSVDLPAALDALRGQINALATGGEIALTVTEISASGDLEGVAAYLRTALAAPITLTAHDAEGAPLGEWTIAPAQIAALLTVTPAPRADGTPDYAVSVDLNGFSAALESLAPGLIIPARDGRFTFNEATRQLEAITPAIHGRQLNIPATIAALEGAVFRVDSRTVELAFDEVLPRYHNRITAAELGITELVANSRTLYTGSTAARRHNIELATGFFNGVILAPGETFSFNTIVGEISAATGYEESAVIFGDRTIKGDGGGVCQVSTTAYRAAFSGGFPIVERHSHGYRVGYYELDGFGPGYDAAIYQPTADFKFTNDTEYHLLVEADFLGDQDALEFRFYSTNPGRMVTVSTPVIRNVTAPLSARYEVNDILQPGQVRYVDWEKEGGDVIITRTISDLQGNTLERRDYGTFYQPWGAVVQVAPGDPRLSG